MKRQFALLKRVAYYYTYKQLPLASAALCYYLIMTFFPLIICLYTLLGNSYDRAMSILAFAENMLSAETLRIVEIFLNYVAANHSTAMFIAGVTLLLTSASAGVRSIEVTLGRMQGGQRFAGWKAIPFSLVFSVLFLITVWFGILVMFTSRDLMTRLNALLPFVDLSFSWMGIKYLLLGGLLFLLLWGMFRAFRHRDNDFATWPGALLGALGMLAVSGIFSRFIAVSTRYSLVYGSLASVILLMLWMFFSGQAMYVGAALNIVLWDRKRGII